MLSIFILNGAIWHSHIAPFLFYQPKVFEMDNIIQNSNLKEMVHDSYVLNYVMWKLGFWKMRIYEPEHKWNHYKIKLYRPICGELRKSSFMAFDTKGKPHMYVSTDYRLKCAKDIDIDFTHQQYGYDAIAAKSVFLSIIKESKMFKWKDLEFFTSNSKHQDLDELLVKADLEQDSFQANAEGHVLSYIERQTTSHLPF